MLYLFVRLSLLVASFILVPLPGGVAPSHSQLSTLSGIDRREGAAAARLAIRSPHQSLLRLRRQRAVTRAQLGADGTTIRVDFRDGGELAILSPRAVHTGLGWAPRALQRNQLQTPSEAASGKAIVLEPFADELQLGPAAGQAEIEALRHSGFTVDVALNGQVTVPLMEKLATYSVVYMETHSGVLPDGDAIVVTGETDNQPYRDLYGDNSLMQAYVAGQTPVLYNAITARFVTKHMGAFPSSSIVFLNGCAILSAPVFIDSMRQQDVATIISWDHNVYDTTAEAAGAFLFSNLAAGESVGADIAVAQSNGLGTAYGDEGPTQLGFVGDGDNTLVKALAAAPPTPTLTATPTATATATSTPTPTRKPARRIKCKKGRHLVHGKCRPCKGHRCK